MAAWPHGARNQVWPRCPDSVITTYGCCSKASMALLQFPNWAAAARPRRIVYAGADIMHAVHAEAAVVVAARPRKRSRLWPRLAFIRFAGGGLRPRSHSGPPDITQSCHSLRRRGTWRDCCAC
jgi:hypothetical protein